MIIRPMNKLQAKNGKLNKLIRVKTTPGHFIALIHRHRRFQAHLEADDRGIPVDQVLDKHKTNGEFSELYGEQKISRREFIRGMEIADIMGFG